MEYYDEERYLKLSKSEKRVYVWIRRQRHRLAVHKVMYYILAQTILEDLQYDYLEKRLEFVEERWEYISDLVTEEGYLSPNKYADALRIPGLESRARRMLDDWERKGSPRWDIPVMSKDTCYVELYRDAMRGIVRTLI